MLMPAILIVDDDTDLRDALAEIFAAAGYSVTTAANGKEALACLDEHRPNVILLDMMMPVMDGRAFLEGKRARPAVADVPVVVASASASDEVPGATAMFGKPCDVGELLGTVAGIVHQSTLVNAPPSAPTTTSQQPGKQPPEVGVGADPWVTPTSRERLPANTPSRKGSAGVSFSGVRGRVG
ncbi:MAG: hypothetical protein A2V77_19195 [Anaeromyxobacter sp. RBG_16_69_14]|nr:MAG: hypothetical protein A2V77_19195 [Anaeromyxobacter sp. RBG_16_69_14]